MATRLKILAIEDDKSIASAYRDYFSRSGYEVRIAKDGETGLKIAQEELPRLIILDLLVPRVNGPAVLRMLKQDPRTRDIPVVVATNLAVEEVQKEVRELGAAAVFVKSDYTLASLLAAIEEILKQQGS